jgi:hypothetical protein
MSAVSWITEEDVAEFLGVDLEEEEDTDPYLATATAAANEWAYRRRRSAGYTDEESTAPNDSVKLGTVLYAGALYRERGSVDSFQSFQDMPVTAPIGSMGQIMRLLGINRPQVA